MEAICDRDEDEVRDMRDVVLIYRDDTCYAGYSLTWPIAVAVLGYATLMLNCRRSDGDEPVYDTHGLFLVAA